MLPGDLLLCRAYDNNGVDIGPLVVKTQGSLTWEKADQVDDSGFLVDCEVVGIKDESQADPLRQQGRQVGTGPCHLCTPWNCQKDIQGWHLGQIKWQDPAKVGSIPWGKNVLSGAPPAGKKAKDLDPLRKMAAAMGFGGGAPPKAQATGGGAAPAAPPPAGATPAAGGTPNSKQGDLEAPAQMSGVIKRSRDVTLFLAQQGVLGAALTDKRAKRARKSAPDKKKKKKKKKKKDSSSSPTSGSSLSSDSGEESSLLKMLSKEENSVAELARKHPGMLLARASQHSAERLDLNYADAAEETFLRPVFQRWAREKSGLPLAGARAEREALTLAKALDFLVQGRLAEVGDVLVQRLKSLSLNQQTQEWGVPNAMELVASSSGQLADPGEVRASARDHRAHTRLMALGKKRAQPPPPADGGGRKGVTWADGHRSKSPERPSDGDSGGAPPPSRRGALRRSKWMRGRGKGRGKGKRN